MKKSSDGEVDVLTMIKIRIQNKKRKKSKYIHDAEKLVQKMKESWQKGVIADGKGEPKFEVDSLFDDLKQLWNEESVLDDDITDLENQLKEKTFVFQCSTDEETSDTQ